MGSNKPLVSVLALCGLLVVLLGAQAAAAASCDATALSPCVGAIMMGGAASPACCARLRSQQACLCQYARDPSYRGYVNSPRAKSVAMACGVPRLKC